VAAVEKPVTLVMQASVPPVAPRVDEPAPGPAAATRPTLGAWWSGLPTGRRAALVGGVALVAVVLAAVPWLARPRPVTVLPLPPWRGFVTATQPLSSGPDAAFASAGPIERGEPVERLAREGELAVVRDASGRVGYVRAADLSPSAPPSRPNEPFTRCQRRPLEPDGAACEQRGRGQLEACRSACPDASCPEQCAARFSDCRASCAQPTPAAGAAPVAPAVAPAAAGVATDEPAKPEPKVKKGKKGAKAPAKRKAKRKTD
jgi:hypothetical protein